MDINAMAALNRQQAGYSSTERDSVAGPLKNHKRIPVTPVTQILPKDNYTSQNSHTMQESGSTVSSQGAEVFTGMTERSFGRHDGTEFKNNNGAIRRHSSIRKNRFHYLDPLDGEEYEEEFAPIPFKGFKDEIPPRTPSVRSECDERDFIYDLCRSPSYGRSKDSIHACFEDKEQANPNRWNDNVEKKIKRSLLNLSQFMVADVSSAASEFTETTSYTPQCGCFSQDSIVSVGGKRSTH